jgi:hypothetical protein
LDETSGLSDFSFIVVFLLANGGNDRSGGARKRRSDVSRLGYIGEIPEKLWGGVRESGTGHADNNGRPEASMPV